MIAGWIRVVGQVTAVVIGRLVTWEIAPMTDQTKLDCPCWSSHGWKWSEMTSADACASLAGSSSQSIRGLPAWRETGLPECYGFTKAQASAESSGMVW